LLSQALNTTPEFWINLQAAYDLARSRPTESVERLAAIG
jgi:plasmid maintenance system antidote protein VapI